MTTEVKKGSETHTKRRETLKIILTLKPTHSKMIKKLASEAGYGYTNYLRHLLILEWERKGYDRSYKGENTEVIK